MTWMNFLHLLEQQPYMELNKEMRIYCVSEDESTNEVECIDYAMVEFTFPTEFGDFDGNMYWQEWMEGGMCMQVRIAPTHAYKNGKIINLESKED